jgi:hypothetical protein
MAVYAPQLGVTHQVTVIVSVGRGRLMRPLEAYASEHPPLLKGIQLIFIPSVIKRVSFV